MKPTKSLLILFIICLIAYIILTYFIFNGPDIIVESNKDYKEVTYTIIDEQNRELKIITYKKELNIGIIRFYSNSNLSLDKQIDLFSEILDRMLQDKERSEIHTLFIGRLINAFGDRNNQMCKRLALSAYESGSWDKEAGEPLNGDLITFIIKLANDEMIFQELCDMFQEHDFNLSLSRVEKVLIGKPELIPFRDKLKKHGIKDDERIPYDFLAWFKVTLN